MASAYWQMLHFVVAATLMSIVCARATAAPTKTSSSAPAALTAADTHVSHAHNNMAAYANLVLQHHHQQQQHQQHQQHQAPQHGYPYDSSNQNDAKSTRRSYSSTHGGLAAAALNGLANLSDLQHISSGYGTPTASAVAKQQIPIYEEQQENDYGGAADGTGTSTGYAGENNQHTNGAAADGLRTAIYNLHAAGTHNDFLPTWQNDGKSLASGTSLSSSSASSSSSSSPWLPATPQLLQSNDKISDSNFLHHYEHNSGYDALTARIANSYGQHLQQQHYQHQHQQQQQQQQQQHQQQQQQQYQPQQQPWQYFTPPHVNNDAHSTTSYAIDLQAPESAPYEYQQSPPTEGSYDVSTNYLPDAHNSNPPPPDVINYVPYPVVKKLHVPVHEPIKIPVSHTVIVPVSKPVPIHIPVNQQVQVPVEKELKIPVERVVPFPVEKHVPVPVEKRVPYPVVKYVPVKVPRPFPVKVPVFKTILHKVKGWW